MNALISEINIRGKCRVSNTEKDKSVAIISPEEIIETIYFGGGTPSLLSGVDVQLLLSKIKNEYPLHEDTEITLEANPDDITPEKLKEWKYAGINRLSIGIQSFENDGLKWMNRIHDAGQAINCIHLARDAGFHNFSIDLIFGIPGMSDEKWIENVQNAIDLKVPHIACYALTVEPKTALQKMIALKKKENINNDSQAVQYQVLMQMMEQAGYEHYEISNFAKPGFRSRHNSSYWQAKKYIGIGPSAHSYNGQMRSWNVANNVAYIKSLEQNQVPFEKEMLTQSQKLNEYMMTSLRTIEGLDLQFIETTFTFEVRSRIERTIENELDKSWWLLDSGHVQLTNQGKLFADAISVKLFS